MDIKDVKYNLNKPVLFSNAKCLAKDSVYILRGCIIRKNDSTGEFYYQAEIADTLCASSDWMISEKRRQSCKLSTRFQQMQQIYQKKISFLHDFANRKNYARSGKIKAEWL